MDPARWQTIVGEVAAYRDTHKVAPSVPLVQTANTGAPGEQPIHNQVTYLAMHTTTPDPAAQARAQADAEATGRSIEQIRDGQALDRPLPAPPQEPVATENTKEDYGPDFGMRMWKEAMRAARAQFNRPNVEHRLPSHDQIAAERDRRRGLRPPTRSGPILG